MTARFAQRSLHAIKVNGKALMLYCTAYAAGRVGTADPFAEAAYRGSTPAQLLRRMPAPASLLFASRCAPMPGRRAQARGNGSVNFRSKGRR